MQILYGEPMTLMSLWRVLLLFLLLLLLRLFLLAFLLRTGEEGEESLTLHCSHLSFYTSVVFELSITLEISTFLVRFLW